MGFFYNLLKALHTKALEAFLQSLRDCVLCITYFLAGVVVDNFYLFFYLIFQFFNFLIGYKLPIEVSRLMDCLNFRFAHRMDKQLTMN